MAHPQDRRIEKGDDVRREEEKHEHLTKEHGRMLQQHLGYNDEDMKMFRENPRNEDVLIKSAATC